ncbi:MAG TPA: redoxin domain-containing protein [Thermodesulfovibrionales bacterium]|jgi:peroxiredoxin (alkyl hydroperoxide reductase subunit C)|nr:redoxin domain-containing protein [Thermodesulfovibrionales bacterium]
MSEVCCGIRIGQAVPDFELETFEPADGKFSKFSLSGAKKAKKWTVLVFYPADFTFICPTELADLADRHQELTKLTCEVLSVSTDTKFVHYGWFHQEKLIENVRYHMGADPKGTVSKLFGVYDDESGLALRGTFIVNPDGVLVSSEINYFNVGRNAEELVRKVEAFSYVWQSPEEVCPAKWRPGGKTLRPSEGIVGRVYEAVK